MQPHEQRVVDEASDLGEKLSKLNDFLLTDRFSELPDDDRILLMRQQGQMDGYYHTLQHRITRF